MKLSSSSTDTGVGTISIETVIGVVADAMSV